MGRCGSVHDCGAGDCAAVGFFYPGEDCLVRVVCWGLFGEGRFIGGGFRGRVGGMMV